MSRGRFITLEGLEGVGKTTNLEFVQRRLQAAGHEVVVTREPGGTPAGEALRALVLDKSVTVCPETELLLMAASRLELVAAVIEPALAAGKTVLCDRFLDASVAYQGGGRQLGSMRVRQLHSLMGMRLEPDVTLLLDMPIAVGQARMQARGEPDRIERESTAFFERARSAYLEAAEEHPDRIAVIDASAELAAVQGTSC